MKINKLTIAGFRGFNAERTIDFNERLTLISGKNSHGKANIAEALEFLIYGHTAKVARPVSGEEYRDSYRNRRYPAHKTAYIEAVFTDDRIATTLRLEIDDAEAVRRFFDGIPVQVWPFVNKLRGTANPFVLQHDLKNLLHAAPSDRFKAFAALAGLDDLDRMQRAIVNLCARPEPSISDNARRALAELHALEARLSQTAGLKPLVEDLKRGTAGFATAYKKVDARCDELVGKKLKDKERTAALARSRDDRASRIYDGSVTVDAADKIRNATLRQKLLAGAAPAFLAAYGTFAIEDAQERLRRGAVLLQQLGAEIIKEHPHACPLCGQYLTQDSRHHINTEPETTKHRLSAATAMQSRVRVNQELETIRSSVSEYHQLLQRRSQELLRATGEGYRGRVNSLFGREHEAGWRIVQTAGELVVPLMESLERARDAGISLIGTCHDGITQCQASVNQAEELAGGIQQYIAAADAYERQLSELEPTLSDSNKILKLAINSAAGTEELSLLIDLLEGKSRLERWLKVREVLDGLKDLKKHVEQTLAETMEAAVGGPEPNGPAVAWYRRLKTTRDPGVQISGAATDPSSTHDLKSKRGPAAESSGKELAGAISSLSESKVNSLGLSVSIATALSAPGPWECLVLDDPIQSWDEEHETQFIDIIRWLIESDDKQIVLLSDRETWVKQIPLVCRSIHGFHYQITGYNEDGPQIRLVDWDTVDLRLP